MHAASPRPTHAAAAKVALPEALLRFITCGSVDDGKSTLIGRLLYDAEPSSDDQLATLGDGFAELRHRRATISISPCWSTASRPSANRASPSTSPTAISRRRGARSSSPTRRATSSTPATWRPAPRPPIWPCCWSMRARASCRRRAATPSSCRCCGVRHVVSPSTRWTSSAIRRKPFRAASSTRLRIFRCALGIFHHRRAFRCPPGDGDNVTVRACRANTPGTMAPTLLDLSRNRRRRRAIRDRRAVPFSGAMGQPPNLHDFRGFAGTIASGKMSGRATKSSRSLPSGRSQRWRVSSRPTAISTTAVAEQAVTLTLTEESTYRGAIVIIAAFDRHGGESPDLRPTLIWMVREPVQAGQQELSRKDRHRPTPPSSSCLDAASRGRESHGRARARRSDARLNEIGEA